MRRRSRTLTGGAILTLSALVLCAEPLEAQVASPLQSGHYAPGVVNIRDFAATQALRSPGTECRVSTTS